MSRGTSAVDLGRPALRPLLVLAAAALFLGPLAVGGVAAGSLSMEARVLVQGHARVGSWMAIEVRLTNDGPAVTGELRIAGGSQGRTRYGLAVDLPTASRKTYVLHAQPPAFGRTIKVELAGSNGTIASADVAYLVHDASQLVVGIVAERPQGIIAELDLQPSLSGSPAVVVPLSIGDLPDRVEGWATLDRLVWQDVDSDQLSTDQLAALRGWLAGGGRLVIVGGTAGIGTLSGFPDDLLPYRPTATIDLPVSEVAGLVGGLPSDAADLPTMAGALARGRALIASGDRVAAAEMSYGSGNVTLLGFDPATPALARTKDITGLWRRFLPTRSGAMAVSFTDDSQMISAVSQLPALALPPAGGLIVLLAAYIAVIGPLNYLVLKRLDRRELAWITMPVLVVVFAGAAYAYGSVLRGTDVLLNEVAIIRGAPDATEGAAQVYFGLFSPTRGSYQVEVPGGALLAAPISGDMFGTGDAATLDVLQGDPARVRDLAVGYGSLRTVRAEAQATVPRLRTAFALKDGTLIGTLENASDQKLELVSVVIGSSLVVLGDIAPGETKPVSLTLSSNMFGQSIADRIVGQPFFDGAGMDTRSQLRSVRYSMLNQLVYDPTFGFSWQLPSDGPVVLAFAERDILDIRVQGAKPRRTGNVLYYIASEMSVGGHVTFGPDLIRQTPISVDAAFFSKDPYTLSLGAGAITMAYRPVAFQGTLQADSLLVSLNFGGGSAPPAGAGIPVDPLPSIPVACTDATNSLPAGCTPRVLDGLPELELWDRTGDGGWVRLPHLSNGSTYAVSGAERFVDPTSGQVLVRFVNDSPDSQIGFSFQLAIGGEVR